MQAQRTMKDLLMYFNKIRCFNYYHTLALLFFIILSIISLKDIVLNPGLIQHRDLEWPYDIRILYEQIAYTLNMDWAKRIIYFGPILIISSILNISAELVEKSIFVFVKILTGFSAYFCIYNLVQNRNSNQKIAFFTSIFSGFIYLYNPIATTMISPTLAFAFAYSLLPFVFLYYRKISETNSLKWPTLVTVSILWTFITAMDIRYLIYTPLFIFFPISFITFLFHSFKKDIHSIIILIKNTVIIVIFFTLFSMYWILPAFVSSTKSDLVPSYILTKNMLDVFSRPTFTEVLRLMGDWWPRVPLENLYNVPNSIWIVASFTILIFAFLPLLTLKNDNPNRENIFILTSTSLLLIFLIKGSSNPFPEFYINLYNIPIFGWMFRVPSKFSMLLALNYTLLIGLQIYNIMSYISSSGHSNFKKVIAFSAIILLLISVAVVSQPAFTGDYNGKLFPKQLSNNCDKLNIFLNQSNEDFKVFIYPNYISWGTPKEAVYVNSNNYLDYSLKHLIYNKTVDFDKLLSPLNVKYIVINDLENDDVISKLSSQKSIKYLDNYGPIFIFENMQYNAPISITSQNVFLSDGFNKIIPYLYSLDKNKYSIILDETFKTEDDLTYINIVVNPPIQYLSLSLTNDENIFNSFISTFEHNPKNVWSRAATSDPLHGEWHYYLEKRGIENWQFDYGKGLILTWAENAILDIPVKIETTGDYVLLVRYFENKDGGEIKVFLDGKPITIKTKAQLNKFVWKNIGTFRLDNGKHDIRLVNVEGFNAVNLFSLVPEREYLESKERTIEILQNKSIIYIFEAESDLHRKKAEISNKFGGEASNGEVIELAKNGTVWQDVEILKKGTYRLALGCEGEFNITIDNKSYMLSSENLNLTYVTPMYLERGKHKLNITSLINISYLDVIWLYSTNNNGTLRDLFTVDDKPAEVVNYEKIDSTKYKIKVNATKPFMLSFSESYDPLWVAEAKTENGKLMQYYPVPLYSVINGFWINQIGEYTVTIRYKPQYYFYIGLIISGLTFSGCMSYLIWYWRKKSII